MYYVSEQTKIIYVYRFTLQELSTRIEEYDALKKSTLFQSMHKIIYDIKYYVYMYDINAENSGQLESNFFNIVM
jgi:hypothetical protein